MTVLMLLECAAIFVLLFGLYVLIAYLRKRGH